MAVVAHVWLPGFYSRLEIMLQRYPEDVALAIFARGQVMDASQGAGAKGIKPGMSPRQARLVCPDLVGVEYVPDRYADTADSLWTACADYSSAVEPCGQHEAFMDLTGSADVLDILDQISRSIERLLGLRPMFGVAGCKLVARIASGVLSQAEPDLPMHVPQMGPSQYVQPGSCLSCLRKREGRASISLTGSKEEHERWTIVAGREKDFLSPLPVRVLWTLEEEIVFRLLRLGVRTVGEVLAMERSDLIDEFGQAGYAIYEYSLGIDRSGVLPIYPKEAITFRKAFDGDVLDEMALTEAIKEGASFIERKLGARAFAARKWGLALGLPRAGRVVRERRLAKPLGLHGGVRWVYQGLLQEALAQPRQFDAVQSLLLTATDLVPAVAISSQTDMFDPHVAANSTGAISAALDRVRNRFGMKSIFPASRLEWDRRDRILVAWEAWDRHEEGKQVASGCGERRSLSKAVLLEKGMASGDLRH